MAQFNDGTERKLMDVCLKTFPEEMLKRNEGLWDILRKITKLNLKKTGFPGADFILIFL